MRSELRPLLTLAIPLAIGHLGQMLIGVTNSAIAGRLGEGPLGAVGLGNSIYFGLTVLGIGMMLSLDPLVAQAVGALESKNVGSLFWQGAWLAALLTVPLTLLVVGVTLALGTSSLPPSTVQLTSQYIYARLPAVLPFLLSVAARSYLQSHGITRPWLIAVVAGNLVNLPLSWLLVLGDEGLERIGLAPWGLGAHGASGAGWAATASTLTQCLIMLGAARAAGHAAIGRVARPDRRVILKALRVGTPIGLTLLAEVAVFSLVTFLMGKIGPRSLAAHNVALSFAGLTFQVTLALGAAASVRVGNAVGAGDGRRARYAGYLALAASACFMGLTGLTFVVAARPLAALISPDEPVIAAAVGLMHVAAAFQLVDGLQVVAAGALRGAGDTRYALYANLLGHYAIGLPIALVLGFGLGWRGPGLWWGLSAGLAAVAAILVHRFVRIASRPIARV